MLLSYKVIKNNTVKNTGAKEIITEAEVKALNPEIEDSIKNNIESYESLAKTLVENARRKGDRILSSAYDEARNIEETAMSKVEEIKKKAYEEGYKQGQTLGYNNAYNETVGKAKIEADRIIESAEAVLKEAKLLYEDYLQDKTEEINKLILDIANSVLKKKIEDSSNIKAMIFETIQNSKKAKVFIIRTNSTYTAELKAEIEVWKEQLAFKGDIFIVPDNSIEPGNALIDKGNGKVKIGIQVVLAKIKDILEGKD